MTSSSNISTNAPETETCILKIVTTEMSINDYNAIVYNPFFIFKLKYNMKIILCG